MPKYLLFLAPIKEQPALYGALPDVWDCKLVNTSDERWKPVVKNWCSLRNICPSDLMVKELTLNGFTLDAEERLRR